MQILECYDCSHKRVVDENDETKSYCNKALKLHKKMFPNNNPKLYEFDYTIAKLIINGPDLKEPCKYFKFEL